MKKLLFLLMLAGMSGLFASGARAADAAAEAIEGAWIVSVGNDPRERFLIVRGARSNQCRVTANSVSYNWIDGGNAPVKDWHCEIVGDELRLRFVSGADSTISIAFHADETTSNGTFVTKNGKHHPVRMTRIPEEELAELRQSAKSAKSARQAARTGQPRQYHANAESRMYLLYVGASDCPSCRGYEVEYFGRKQLMATVVPDFPKLTYVSSNIGSYKNRDRVGEVPAELKWVAGNDDKGKALLKRRGVPFFALVVDDRIWAQGHGVTALDNLLAPEIRRAVAEKYTSR